MSDREEGRDKVGRPGEQEPPGGKHIVESWSDWLSVLRQDWVPQSPAAPDHAHDLLALWKGLDRFAPVELEPIADKEDLGWLSGRIGEVKSSSASISRVIDLALSALPLWPEWKKAAQKLEGSYEQDWPVDVRARLARELLQDLDRAELVGIAIEDLLSGELEGDVETRVEEINEMVGWVCEKADVFTAGAAYVKAVTQSFRPDLAQVDPDLYLTTAKFERISDQIREVLRVGLFESVEPFSGEQAEALVELVEKKRAERERELASWFRSRSHEKRHLLAERPAFPSYEPVAAAAAARSDRRDTRLDFVSEDGSWTAIINLPDPRFAADDEDVRLLIRGGPKTAVRAFVSGKSAGIEREGSLLVATFGTGVLRDAWLDSDVPTVALELEDGSFVAGMPAEKK